MVWKMNTHGFIQAGDVFTAVRSWTKSSYPTARLSAAPIDAQLNFYLNG